ncbi:hypothetical protein DRN74_02475 [Candidatus Micrarchaeota archaeon]|nr:MAG: hypothetical protein DRN74_02475 [Candidatus Micrarchaeota archaeon]
MAKIHKFKGRLYTEIPREVVDDLGISEDKELNFVRVYPRLYVVSVKEGEKEDLERKVIEKAMKIPHSKREKDAFLSSLSKEEKRAYEQLLKKKILFEYKSKGKEMVGIDRAFVKKEESELINKLERKGYHIMEDDAEAKKVNEEIMKHKRENDFLGIKGFDKKYYLISRKKLAEVENKILKALSSEKSVKQVAESLGYKEELCLAAIRFLEAEGKIFEKKKGIYKAI